MRQMTEIAEREQYSVIGVMPVPAADVSSYGIVETEAHESVASAGFRASSKSRQPGTTSSTLGVVGRYVLTPRIFHHLRTMPPGAGGEIQLTDGIARLLEDEKVLAYEFEGRRYDCGNKLGYLEATVELGAEASRCRRAPSPNSSSACDDVQRASLHRRRRAGTQLRPRRAALLHQPAGAVGGDPEARGGAGHADFRARQERGHRDAGRRAHRRAGAEGPGGSGQHPRHRAGGTQPAGRPVPARA